MLLRCDGFVDLQVNGAIGVDINNPGHLTVESLEDLCRYQAENGVVRFLPTIISNPDEVIREILVRIAEVKKQSELVRIMIPGVHLEAYVAEKAKGCHNPKYLRNPDWAFIERLEELADLICLITVAPELPGTFDFIGQAKKVGKRVAIGHTLANPGQISAAYNAGAILCTHLGNGVPTTLPRHGQGNPIWRQLAIPNFYASFIPDFHHIDPETLRDFITLKGVNRSIVVTDSIFATGLGDGEYDLNGQNIAVRGGRVYLKSNPEVLAGSVATTLQCFANLLLIGFEPHQVLFMMSSAPAKIMNWPLDGCNIELELGEKDDLPRVKKLCISKEMQIV